MSEATTKTAFEATLAELAEAFIEDTRANGSKFVRLRDGRPDWMRDAVHEAHGDAGPNDWHYNACRDIAVYLAEAEMEDTDCEPWDDALHCACDSLTDVYTSNLLKWLAEAPGALYACDEAAEDAIVAADTDMESRIRTGQYFWLRAIGRALCAAVVAQVEAGREAEVAK